MLEIQYFRMHICIVFTDSAVNSNSCVCTAGQQALTLGLLRGLEERPVDAPLTERDLTTRPDT